MRNNAIRVGLVLLLSLSTAVAGEVSGGARPLGRGTAGPLQTGGDPRVRMVDNAFRPRTLNISRGDRVTWVNRGDNVHTSTSNRGLWDSDLMQPGERFSRRFRRAGTFRYHCEIHANMTGRIVVA
jgi:plastocyanin